MKLDLFEAKSKAEWPDWDPEEARFQLKLCAKLFKEAGFEIDDDEDLSGTDSVGIHIKTPDFKLYKDDSDRMHLELELYAMKRVGGRMGYGYDISYFRNGMYLQTSRVPKQLVKVFQGNYTRKVEKTSAALLIQLRKFIEVYDDQIKNWKPI